MPADLLLVGAQPGETRLAVVEGGEVVQFVVHRPHHAFGAVWLGRVVNVAGGTAFVDIGRDRPGAAPAAGLAEGQAVLVQALGEAAPGKGVPLSPQLSVTGRRMVLTPQRPGLAVSRNLPAEERARLSAIGKTLAPPGEGLVLRTAAVAATPDGLAAELDHLRRRLAALQEAARSAKPPALLQPADPVGRLLADHPGIGCVLVDDATAFAALRAVHGDVVERRPDAFAAAEEALEAALSPAVPLPGGGNLIIEQGVTATLVDVNGSGRPEAVNAAAAMALARQMRLRNLSGRILFDAIPGRGGRDKLLAALRAAVADDPVPTHVVGSTPLGLVEITRERRWAPLAEVMLERIDRPSAEAVALAALRAVLRTPPGPGRPRLRLAPAPAAALERNPARAEAERRLGQRLEVVTEPARRHDSWEIAWE